MRETVLVGIILLILRHNSFIVPTCVESSTALPTCVAQAHLGIEGVARAREARQLPIASCTWRVRVHAPGLENVAC